jgi:Uma2 family endonuclease
VLVLIVEVFPGSGRDVTMRRSDVPDHLEAAMPAESIEYVPMAFEKYLALPDDVRAEWVDGVAIVMTPGTWRHNNAALRLAIALDASLSGVMVVTEGGVRTGHRKYRFGDVAVLPVADVPEGQFSEVPPLLIVEVLSPSTRGEDLVRKSHEYQVAGVGQYWVLDREEPSLRVHANDGDGWLPLLTLDADHLTGSVVVGEHGTVEVDLNALLAT